MLARDDFGVLTTSLREAEQEAQRLRRFKGALLTKGYKEVRLERCVRKVEGRWFRWRVRTTS
jgi:hypothetical protein